MAEQNPNLMNKNAMERALATDTKERTTVHEIFTKINNAKDKPKKIEVLRQYNNSKIRMLLKAAFDPKIEWDIPEGTPPFMANEAPVGTEHTYLEDQATKLFHFIN